MSKVDILSLFALNGKIYGIKIWIYSLLQQKREEYFKPYFLSPVKFNALMLIKHLGGDQGIS